MIAFRTVRRQRLARVALYRALATALQGGLSLPAAARLLRGMDDEAAFARVAAALERGSPLAEALASMPYVPAAHRRVMAAADGAGHLPQALVELADEEEAIAEEQR